MIEEEAYVAEVSAGQVWLEKSRQTACSGCKQSCPSAMADGLFSGKIVRLPVASEIPLKPGDKVIVGIEESALASGSLWVYLLPLLGLFAGALIGKSLGGADLASALGGLVGIGLCFMGLKFGRLFDRPSYQPVILRKID
jgi:sigma-E factor negative regulatory protein RseC